jgi:CHC2 zinc finger
MEVHMSTTAQIDFQALKQRVSIDQAVQFLGLQLRQSGPAFRGPCPVCRSGGERALVVTPSKAVWYCFSAKKGGDQLALVAHIKDCGVREAAEQMEAHFGASPPLARAAKPAAAPTPPQQERGALQPLSYLQPEHPSVQAMGVSVETAKAWGAGYAAKGILRGRMAIPLYSREGVLLAYTGRAVGDESPMLTFPNGFQADSVIFGQERVVPGDLYIVRDPLQVLQAFEAGSENVVAFLTDGISAQQWEQLSSLMDQKQCEKSYLF